MCVGEGSETTSNCASTEQDQCERVEPDSESANQAGCGKHHDCEELQEKGETQATMLVHVGTVSLGKARLTGSQVEPCPS